MKIKHAKALRPTPPPKTKATQELRNRKKGCPPIVSIPQQQHPQPTRHIGMRSALPTGESDYYDPTSKTSRKVCAQPVNFGNNQKPFWTTEVYVEVLQNGKMHPHTRDVALWCDTGKEGYIRNTDTEDWCAFGPGTTFYFASGTGTKISILTYSPISSTTIDGQVPTLDKERTEEERNKPENAGIKDHIYVYSYTTQDPTLRQKIVIGDDYSYYQWIETATQAANMVNLHIDLDNQDHGTISNISTVSGYEAEEREDGGYAIHVGDRVRVNFERNFGFKLDKIVDLDKLDKDGNPLAVLQMRKDGKVDMVDFNNAYTTQPVDQNADGTWGIASGDNKTVFVLKKTEEEGKRTQYEVEFDITTHRNLEIVYQTNSTYYITYNTGQQATGAAPLAQWVEEGDKFTIPKNRTLYYEGNTLHHWVDENNKEYIVGKEYEAPAQDLRLLPVFQANDFNIIDLDKKATVTWNFARNDGAPTMAYEGSKGILVSQLYKDDKWIDLKIDLDATTDKKYYDQTISGKGKFSNTNKEDRMQINDKSVITFPASPNCVARLTAKTNTPEAEIDQMAKGNKNYQEGTADNGIYWMEVTCPGDRDNQQVLIKAKNQWCVDFMVTYQPQDLSNKPAITSLTCGEQTLTAEAISKQLNETGCITFTVSPWDNQNETIPAITGEATHGGKIEETTKPTLLTKESTITLKMTNGIIVNSYPVKFEFTQPETAAQIESVFVNGVKVAADAEISNVHANGIIKVMCNRTMQASTLTVNGKEFTASAGKELVFTYWGLPEGTEIAFTGTFQDIYSKACEQSLNLKLHITDEEETYHHHKFDFIVGQDGTIDEAIEAANNNTKEDNHRYYIFVPDGEYQLTGNEPLDSYGVTSDGKWPCDNDGKQRSDMQGKNNGRTVIKKPNVSLIGQSKDETIIYNKPIVEGISYTGTIHIGKEAKDFYAQDLILENRFDYWNSMLAQGSGGAARGVAFWDQGCRSTLKNVALKSWQDTYFSNNANSDYRGYFEDCDFAGVVDWLCGDGNIWLERCNIILRDRSGNNITAPAQGSNHEWGYVFNNCTIKTETKYPEKTKDKDWTLGRPWNGSPACTYLNTTMYLEPRTGGWNSMNSGEILRFHEYNTMDQYGDPLSLGTRSLASCSPAAGSDDCVLNAQQAAKYNVNVAMTGTDGYEPVLLCRQIDAASTEKKISTEEMPEDRAAEDTDNHIIWDDNLILDDDNLKWTDFPAALCYFVFKLDESTGKWIYKENTTANSVNLSGYGSGYYCVRAANQRGGLGAPTQSIHYVLTDPYELEIKQVGTVKGYGWSTICLPFNAKVPEAEGLKVYAATAHNKTDDSSQVTDFTMTLTPVDVLNAEKGYVVYGPIGSYSFKATSRTSDTPTILKGNPDYNAISSVNVNCYVLSNKTWGLGFYKYIGSTLAANRAWLPQDMVTDQMAESLSAGSRCIRLEIAGGTTDLRYPILGVDAADGAVYNMQGQRIEKPVSPGIYIVKNKGKILKK